MRCCGHPGRPSRSGCFAFVPREAGAAAVLASRRAPLEPAGSRLRHLDPRLHPRDRGADVHQSRSMGFPTLPRARRLSRHPSPRSRPIRPRWGSLRSRFRAALLWWIHRGPGIIRPGACWTCRGPRRTHTALPSRAEMLPGERPTAPSRTGIWTGTASSAPSRSRANPATGPSRSLFRWSRAVRSSDAPAG